MKIAGKRIPKGNLLLFFSFAAISLCLLLIVSATRAEKTVNVSKNNLYTGHQREFYIAHAKEADAWDGVMPELAAQYTDFAVYLPLEEQEIFARGVCVQGKVEIPPMLEGKYFDYSTSWTERPTAVIGKTYGGGIRERGGKKFYTIGDTEYEVIGVMGTEQESRINSMVLIDFKSAVRMAGINAGYVLDTRNEADYYEIGTRLSQEFPAPADVTIMLDKPRKQTWIAELLSGGMILDTLYVMVLSSFSLSTVLVTIIWLRFRRQLLFACVLCGLEKRSRRWEVWKRFLGVAGVGFVVGLFLMLILSGMISDISFNAMDSVQAFGVTVALGAVILMCSLRLCKSK